MVVQVVRSLAIITLSLSLIYVAGTTIPFGWLAYQLIAGLPPDGGSASDFRFTEAL